MPPEIKGTYGIVVGARLYHMTHEEMVELLYAGAKSQHGNEYHDDMKKKVTRIYNSLPKTAY